MPASEQWLRTVPMMKQMEGGFSRLVKGLFPLTPWNLTLKHFFEFLPFRDILLDTGFDGFWNPSHPT